MPGFDENLDIPASLEPPRLDADEVLPSQLHPSYPFGRPKGDKGKTAGAGGNLRAIAGNMMPQDEERRWSELNLTAVVERPDGREVPPVMAVSWLWRSSEEEVARSVQTETRAVEDRGRDAEAARGGATRSFGREERAAANSGDGKANNIAE